MRQCTCGLHPNLWCACPPTSASGHLFPPQIGCICPPTSEQTCEAYYCLRRHINDNADTIKKRNDERAKP